jgi:hypothetical protein
LKLKYGEFEVREMKNLIKLIAVMALSSFSINASAYILSEVGSYDVVKYQATLSNSGNAEKNWVKSIFGADYDYMQLTNSNGSNWESVTDGVAGDYAFDIGFEPTFYLLKLGGGNGTGTDDTHYLLENKGVLSKAFINLSFFGEGIKLDNISVISHVGAAGSGDVPEPGVVGLLAIGLLGMIVRRRMKQ